MTVFSSGGIFQAWVEMDGNRLAAHPHDGQHYVGARPGASFALVVRNCTSRRLEVVTSVDGRNTLTDEAAGIDSSGMVIGAGSTCRFTGWRLNDDGTREFVFSDDIERSVVHQAGGDTGNAGVIGIAAWREQQDQPAAVASASPWPRGSRTDVYWGTRGMTVNSAAPAAGASAGPQDLSAGIGTYKADPVGRTTFTRTGTPDIVVIRYASEAALEAAGIIGARKMLPDPFPADGGYARYQ